MNEANTCRKHVVPKLQAAKWENEPHSLTEQRKARSATCRANAGRPAEGAQSRRLNGSDATPSTVSSCARRWQQPRRVSASKTPASGHGSTCVDSE